MRFVSGGTSTSAATIADWVIPRMQVQQRDHGTGMWLILAHTASFDDGADGRFAGWVQLRTPRHSAGSELELSYRLRRAAWGRGYAAEASQTLIDSIFRARPIDRVFAGTQLGHTASRRVLERLGMRLSADTDLRLLTSPESLIEYELLRTMWESEARTRRTACHALP